MERCWWSDAVVGTLARRSRLVASTTRTKHCFMCRPSLQDPRRSCRKPHLLPWSGAIAPQPDPNKHHPFFHRKKKKRLKERVLARGEEGARSVQKASAEPRVSAGMCGVCGVEEPRKGNHRRITSVGLHVSARLHPFGRRYIDLLTLSGAPPVLPASLHHPEALHPLPANHNSRWHTLRESSNYSTRGGSPPPTSDLQLGRVVFNALHILFYMLLCKNS